MTYLAVGGAPPRARDPVCNSEKREKLVSISLNVLLMFTIATNPILHRGIRHVGARGH